MSRVLKFRAWDKARKEMVYVLDMKFMFEDKNGYWVSGYDNKSIGHEVFHESLELMQFTGLRDRNGKEIYEGDILKRDRFVDWVVVWEKNGFHIYNKFTPEQKFAFLEATDREVIGNIYEGEPCDTSKR